MSDRMYEEYGFADDERRTRRRFLSSPQYRDNFRKDLLLALIEVAKALKPLGISQIKGQSAEHLDKLQAKFSWVQNIRDVVRKSTDDLYPTLGFQTDVNGDYLLAI